MRSREVYDNSGRRKYLSKAEGQSFVSQTPNLPRERALFCLTLYYTGCRISEALALRFSDIEAETGIIRFRTLKKRNRHEIRRIPAPDFLITQLQNLRSRRRSLNSPLWAFSRTTAWRIVKRAMTAAQLSGIHATARGLRHGFGVRGAMQKIPVSLIQLWMGHSHSDTTAIYLDVKDDEERELMEKTWV